jgi:hypothetical protein
MRLKKCLWRLKRHDNWFLHAPQLAKCLKIKIQVLCVKSDEELPTNDARCGM